VDAGDGVFAGWNGLVELYGTLGNGGTVYFAGKSDLSTLLDDLALVRLAQRSHRRGSRSVG
jgi:hypothetical protein